MWGGEGIQSKSFNAVGSGYSQVYTPLYKRLYSWRSVEVLALFHKVEGSNPDRDVTLTNAFLLLLLSIFFLTMSNECS